MPALLNTYKPEQLLDMARTVTAWFSGSSGMNKIEPQEQKEIALHFTRIKTLFPFSPPPFSV